jgi:UDP-N-acetylmuramoylalanine--D-glutamate ligase
MNPFPPNLFEGRRYAVVGLGRAGMASLRALSGMGATVTGWDDAGFACDAAAREGFVIADPTPDIGDFHGLVLAPGIPHLLPVPHRIAAAARLARVPILADAELLYQAVRLAGGKARFVGITGTNGKSTTTALLAFIMALAGVPHAAGANLGPPALSLGLLPDNGIYVLEMSSYMLERLVTLRFDVAAMLNLSPDHLDRHGDMAGYEAAKRQIFARQDAGDVAIIGTDDAASRSMAQNLPRARRISAVDAPDLRAARALPGAHNAQNAAVARALAESLGIERATIIRGIAEFPGLPHRQELVGTIGGIDFINDSKATNADAASRALGCYERIIWITGGIAKDGGIDTLTPYFSRLAQALLIGQDGPAFAATLGAHGVRHDVVETLDRAVPESLRAARAQAAKIVLLSPACASFDQFSGFEARGDHFRALVAGLRATVGEAA